jgi:hypothetical protein
MAYSPEDVKEIEQIGEAVSLAIDDIEPQIKNAIRALTWVLGASMCSFAENKADLKRLVLGFTKEFKQCVFTTYERNKDQTTH